MGITSNLFLCAMAFWGQVALSQTPKSPTPPHLPPYRSIVLGVPYSADRVTTMYVRGAVPERIAHTSSVFQARNSEGWEVYRTQVQSADTRQKPQIWYILWDPVAHTRTDWCTCKPVAYRKQFGEPYPLRAASPTRDNYDTMIEMDGERQKFHVERIGTEQREGVDVEVLRATHTVKAGTDGNDHDLTTTITRWYSPRLRQNIALVTDDPEVDLRKVELKNVSLSEPDPELFRVPKGYVIKPAAESDPEQFE